MRGGREARECKGEGNERRMKERITGSFRIEM